MKSYEIARLFERMADVLEMKGENPFRIRAYRRAAQNLETLSEDVETLAREERLDEIPGIGADLAGKIGEYLESGRVKEIDAACRTVPRGVVEGVAGQEDLPMQTKRVMPIVVGAFVVSLAVAAATLTALGQIDLPDGRGRMLFSEHGCAACHTVGTLGMPAGPDLSHVGSKYSADYLRAWLTDPASRRPWAHMPKLQLTYPEIEALADYLASQT